MKPFASLLTIALVGNPNTGKSTLFTALSGVRQRIGNYPGVTVEKKLGRCKLGDVTAELIDLPGAYSLAPRSPDEMVAVDVLLNRQSDSAKVDGVLSVIDASNLQRNLYLLSQVLDLGLPTVVALNMTDIARERGMEIDVAALSRRLRAPVVVIQANNGLGLESLKSELAGLRAQPLREPHRPFSAEFYKETKQLGATIASERLTPMPLFLVERLLLDSSGYLQSLLLPSHAERINADIVAARQRLEEAGQGVPAVEAVARYGWVGKVLDGVLKQPQTRTVSNSDSLDRVLTHRVWGTAIFALLMLAVFCSVFIAADPIMAAIESGVGMLQNAVEPRLPPGALRSLVVNGVIAGVGGVLVFLPQIAILFFFIAVLEDCGYMARAAYLMDKLMSRLGLSGKSFIPLLSSFACAIPGIMGARVIENRRDRLTTILIAPLMSCSARLPVYGVLIAAFIPNIAIGFGLIPLQGLVLFAMYLVGMVAAAIVAWVLKRTLLRGPTPPFVMELPGYKWPSPRVVGMRVAERAWGFIYRAGTLILAVSIVIWAVSYYPHNVETVEAPYRVQTALLERDREAAANDKQLEIANARLLDIERKMAADYQKQSYLGQAGRLIEPAVRPLGWDWRIGCAVLASFPAREVVIGTLGVIYNLGGDLDVAELGDRGRLESRLQAARWDGTNRPVYNIPVALSIMVFFALCAQCASTLVVMRRETGSWGWPAFTFIYMTTLAYAAAFATYQIGIRLG